MIEKFNEVEIRDSGIIYNSALAQIKKMYAIDPVKAGELAIAAIEMVLTGQISSDDPMIDMMLEPLLVVRNKNAHDYDQKKQANKNKKATDMKLKEISELYLQGFSQKAIGERLGISQQTVSYRLNSIKADYPELLQKESLVNDENLVKIEKVLVNGKP